MQQATVEFHRPAVRSSSLRWRTEDVEALFDLPFNELIFRAQTVHREHFDPSEVQLSTLLSIKTGGCPENCGYCPQSVHFDTPVEATPLMKLDVFGAPAKRRRTNGRAVKLDSGLLHSVRRKRPSKVFVRVGKAQRAHVSTSRVQLKTANKPASHKSARTPPLA